MKMDYPKIVVFILLSLLFDIAEESCKANVNIPSLHKSTLASKIAQIQISSMYKDNRPSEHATYNYIHNYPVDILHTETVNSLLCTVLLIDRYSSNAVVTKSRTLGLGL